MALADYIYKCLADGDLPLITNANKKYYKIKSIYLKETSELIGFIDMYHGYPKDIEKTNRENLFYYRGYKFYILYNFFAIYL